MATDIPAPAKPKPNILKIIIYFVAGVIIMTTAATNLLVVYVLFAPDNLPKPIYLVYQLPAGVTPQPGLEGATPEMVQGGSANPITIITGQQVPQAAEPVASDHGGSSATSGHSTEGVEEVSPGHGIMIDTSTKIVNLAEPGGKKFIRVTATLEFAPPAGYSTMPEEEKTAAMTEFTAGINAKIPVLDDTIVTLLSAKEFAAVYSTEGKDTLRQEIIDAINARLPEYKVIYVYFKEFVMQ